MKVDAADVSKVNPCVPFWGGPAGSTPTAPPPVTPLLLRQLQPPWRRRGALPHAGHQPRCRPRRLDPPALHRQPGLPGDSGSAFLDAEGNALGTLSTLAIAPLAGSNGVGDLSHELAYAQANGGIAGLALVPGTEPFSPIL